MYIYICMHIYIDHSRALSTCCLQSDFTLSSVTSSWNNLPVKQHVRVVESNVARFRTHTYLRHRPEEADA